MLTANMENETLRKEINHYIKRHDLMHLFERLTASIMFDRPDDLNSYICEWLIRLSGSAAEQNISCEEQTERISKHKNTQPQSFDNVSRFSESLLHLTSDYAPVEPVRTSEGNLPAPNSSSNSQFTPFLLSPENISTFYSILDPLNSGGIAAAHFREVAHLLDLEQYIDWNSVSQEIDRDLFCEQLASALSTDLSSLRIKSGKLSPEPDPEGTPTEDKDIPQSTNVNNEDFGDEQLALWAGNISDADLTGATGVGFYEGDDHPGPGMEDLRDASSLDSRITNPDDSTGINNVDTDPDTARNPEGE
ncbi:uncharacterized protein LOC129585782 isoform X2 [Paramacrobiotus metropolitanus]|uniref:uncharacterized protein LOC129585782 isoform X2 n=1 Tax=Paramacrobiotus metropolitanus TaxID=2943436 RepID=UPI0024458BFC|nr:uncharacterized protein LOC129585782 isoform X2 [Paramacrobiotus metropolitanus]